MLQAIVSVTHELSPWLLLGALVSGLMHAFCPIDSSLANSAVLAECSRRSSLASRCRFAVAA